MTISQGVAEGQVLQRLSHQRGACAEIQGTTKGSGPLLATLKACGRTLKGWNCKPVGKAEKGRFHARLVDIPTGGPYRLEFRCGAEVVAVEEFYVGDVWLLAGQSNMEGVGNRDGAAQPHPLVRTFTMRREWRMAVDPLHVLGESPDICHHGGSPLDPGEADLIRATSPKGVGVGVFFGREMVERSGVPQGLICTAHGGTSMDQWSPGRRKDKGKSLYASMLSSWAATGQPIAGVLWYQGESDTSPADHSAYTKKMKTLTTASRRHLNQSRLPWIIVQIGRYFGPRSEEEVQAWNSIQDQQRLLPSKIKHLEMVSAVDLGLDDPIHISAAAFPLLAKRLASAADRMTNPRSREKRPPQFTKLSSPGVNREDRMLDIQFDHVVGSLRADGEPSGFSLLNTENQDFQMIFKTTLHGDTARIHFRATHLKGLKLSHGHGLAPHCTIKDGRGFPLPVFGPIDLSAPAAFFPFVCKWKVTPVIVGACQLKQLQASDMDFHQGVEKTYGKNGFVNERAQWEGKRGQCYFSTRLELPEPMRLVFLMGYDGPFRLWLNSQPFFTDLNGMNPCVSDQSCKAIRLPAGVHDIRVGMDLNGGRAWGFSLRFERKDLSPTRIKSKDYLQAIYL